MPLLAYDIKQRKVGCVLLQVAMGGSSVIAQQIPIEDWLLAPTPDLQVYRLTDDEVAQLIKMHRNKKR